MSIRNSKGALQALLQRGSVGDDLWQRFQRAEKEIEEELNDDGTSSQGSARISCRSLGLVIGEALGNSAQNTDQFHMV